MAEAPEHALANATAPDPAPDSTRDPASSPAHDEDRIDGTSTAWRLLTSPRVFFGLTAALALVLAWAHTVPQRATEAELARAATFAEVEALSGLGLGDVWTSWLVLLLLLLLALVGTGMLMNLTARRRHGPDTGGVFVTAVGGHTVEAIESLRGRIAEAMGQHKVAVQDGPGLVVARRGFAPEAAASVVLGLVALLASVFIARGNSFEARFTVIPGQSEDPSEVAVRDGDLFLPRALPLDLRCSRPDPMDPLRRTPCTFASAPGTPPEQVVLTPGASTSTEAGVTLAPLRETPRFFGASLPVELLLRRGEAVERLVLTPGQPVELQASGDRLTAFIGPDGPLVLWARKDQPPTLLAPPISAAPVAAPFLSAVLPTEQLVQATRSPASLLTIIGLALVLLGLLAMALFPSLTVTLEREGAGTRVSVRSPNRPLLARLALVRLVGGGS